MPFALPYSRYGFRIDYSRITDELVVAANVVGGATAVLLAGFVAVATGLN